MAKAVEPKLTDKGRMNIWVGEQIRGYERLAAHTSGMHTLQAEAHVRGVIAGMRILQDAWLRGEFEHEVRDEN